MQVILEIWLATCQATVAKMAPACSTPSLSTPLLVDMLMKWIRNINSVESGMLPCVPRLNVLTNVVAPTCNQFPRD